MAPIAALLERTCLGAAAAVTLVATGSDVATGTQRLDQLLDSPDADERGCAVTELAWAIADPGFATQRARLAALIGDPAWNVRVAALAAASQLGPAAEPLLPAIVAQLQPYRTHMEWQAISHALVAMKGAALPALPELLRLLVENPDGARMFYPAYVSILRAHPETADQIRAAIADEGYWARLLGEQVIEQAKLAP